MSSNKGEERGFKGIWIPKEVWEHKSLTLMEKIALVEINTYDNNFGCVASNATLSKNLDIKPNTFGNIVRGLESKGFIKTSYDDMNCYSGRVIKVVKEKYFGIENTPLENQEPPLENQEHSNSFSNSFSKKNLNINDDLKKSSDKKEPHKSFKPMVKYFCEEYWPTYDFKGPRDGKQINEIIKQIEKLFEKNGREVTPDSITEFFKMVIQNLPKFYQFKNLTKINSGFSEIIEEIKNSKNGQQKPLTRNQQVGEESRAFQERIRARAARNNS